MDLSKILLVAIDIFFFLFVLVLLATTGLLFYLLFIDDLPFYFNESEVKADTGIVDLAKPIMSGIVQLIYVATLFYLRKGIKGMVAKNFFHDSVAINLNIAGVLLTLVSLGSVLFNFINDLSEGILSLGMETSILKSEIFMVIIGLFLMLMARVINEGLALKSENELTI